MKIIGNRVISYAEITAYLYLAGWLERDRHVSNEVWKTAHAEYSYP